MLMIIIMLTGNYNFFNFLFMALCLSLADDSWIGGNIFNKPQHPLTREKPELSNFPNKKTVVAKNRIWGSVPNCLLNEYIR